MHIEFITRLGSFSPYLGEYQFQYMTDEEIKMYKPILKIIFEDEYSKFEKIWFKKPPLR